MKVACLRCQVPFETEKPKTAKYCSAVCRSKAWQQRRQEKALVHVAQVEAACRALRRELAGEG